MNVEMKKKDKIMITKNNTLEWKICSRYTGNPSMHRRKKYFMKLKVRVKFLNRQYKWGPGEYWELNYQLGNYYRKQTNKVLIQVFICFSIKILFAREKNPVQTKYYKNDAHNFGWVKKQKNKKQTKQNTQNTQNTPPCNQWNNCT